MGDEHNVNLGQPPIWADHASNHLYSTGLCLIAGQIIGAEKMQKVKETHNRVDSQSTLYNFFVILCEVEKNLLWCTDHALLKTKLIMKNHFP